MEERAGSELWTEVAGYDFLDVYRMAIDTTANRIFYLAVADMTIPETLLFYTDYKLNITAVNAYEVKPHKNVFVISPDNSKLYFAKETGTLEFYEVSTTDGSILRYVKE